MVIYLTGDVKEGPKLDELTPRQIVAELDKYVVGQHAAKRSVAIALRNDWPDRGRQNGDRATACSLLKLAVP